MTTQGSPTAVPLIQLRVAPPAASREAVDRALSTARDWLLGRQHADGYWCGELEGDTTLESYIILLEAFFGRLGGPKVEGLARTIRGEALDGGGWAQFPGGPPDLSVSCLSYLALKVAGDPPTAPHLRAARAVIAGLGGPARANSYTRYHLALFGQISWDEVPAIPPEMLFLPGGSPISVYDMSSWSRTIFVPLSILYGMRAVCRLPPERGVSELLDIRAEPPEARSPVDARLWSALFEKGDRVVKLAERLPGSSRVRRAAIARAAEWMIERLEGSDGLSAILPAMVNSVLALKCLGHAEDGPLLRENLRHLDDLVLSNDAGELRVQPCVSPVWDTVLAGYALSLGGLPAEHDALARTATWLVGKQCRTSGDWARRNPAPPGGWFFEHRNAFYPDVDDTCMALIVLRRARAGGPVDAREQEACVARGLAWMLGMQNDDGGFASFDRGNDKEWLTRVPFADHNAMIDPSTADITGRVLECLAHFPAFADGQHPVVRRAVEFLKRDQATDGSWYGRWGVNHIYGTWQALRGLRAAGVGEDTPCVRRAVTWLESRQNQDGGWGESIASYTDPDQRGVGASTPSQTAWAVMGLLAGGSRDRAVERGIRHLVDGQDDAGTWEQALWTGTGFPRVFYLNYHLYRHTFPLMALAQYRAARG